MALEIVAVLAVSLSELQTVEPEITQEWIENNPEEFKKILHGLGMNTEYPVEQQDVTHRNRFGNIITCPRWVGNERTDTSWVESGYASYEAVAKSSRNRLLIDIFRQRGLVEVV